MFNHSNMGNRRTKYSYPDKFKHESDRQRGKEAKRQRGTTASAVLEDESGTTIRVRAKY